MWEIIITTLKNFREPKLLNKEMVIQQVMATKLTSLMGKVSPRSIILFLAFCFISKNSLALSNKKILHVSKS